MEALSVREYRNNLAASFTKADNGEQVLIRRKNEIYALVKVGREDLMITPELQARIDKAREEIKSGKCVTLKSSEDIEVDGFPKAKKYTVDEIAANGYNIDLCGFPHEEEEILDPMDLINQYQEKRASLNAEIDHVLEKITSMLGGN